MQIVRHQLWIKCTIILHTIKISIYLQNNTEDDNLTHPKPEKRINTNQHSLLKQIEFD